MNKVFITAELPGKSIQLLKNDFSVETFSKERLITKDELIEGAKDAHALISTVSDKIDETVIDRCANLIVISNYGVGFDNVDIDYATKKGIFVSNTPDVLTETTADLGWALMFAAARRVIEGDSFTRRVHSTKNWDLSLLLGTDVYGKILGIYGMGRIGVASGRRAKGFGMRVIYYNRKRNEQGERDTGAEYVDFPTLLGESDFLLITAPLNESTKGRFGLEEFRRMKKSSILINIGRGPIVKEKELAIALKEGSIRGAGLDVYEREPIVERELLNLENAVLLPHLGSATGEAREKMADMAAESVVMALKGQTPRNLVNRKVLEIRR